MKRKTYKGTYSVKSDAGKVRISNEDQGKVLVNSNGNVLLAVADGMGGHHKGDYASYETVKIIFEAFKTKKWYFNEYDAMRWMNAVTRTANGYIYRMQDGNEIYQGMGTTLVMGMIYKNKLVVLNSGDSRLYVVRDKKLVQLTEDQTYVDYLLMSGQITQEEAINHPKRHVLTNAIGLFPSLSADLRMHNYNGETILLCSDGLYNNVSEQDILNILLTTNSTEDKCDSLISLANFNGGDDNITVVLWESYDDQD